MFVLCCTRLPQRRVLEKIGVSPSYRRIENEDGTVARRSARRQA